jgi:subtilisin family serine protease
MPNLNDTLLAKFKSNVSESRKNGFGNRNKYTRKSDPIDDELAKINVRRFKTPPGQAIAEAVRHNLSLDSDLESIEADGEGYGTPITPNDPSYSAQWHLPKINADDAWDDTQGDPSVVIAVLDTGVQYDHPDLVGRLVRGPSYVTGVTVSDDDHWHGTAVTGCIVANINNGLGVSGVAPKCLARVSKILDSTNWGSYSWWASAIINAADAGVEVINISAGGTSSSSTLQSAVNYAWNKGVVIVAAAGNTGGPTLNYPAACTNVVGVSATTSSDALAGFSTRGPAVDIAAPGEGIVTTHLGGGYSAPNGTSFASPLVAGAVGLVRSIDPNLSASEVVAILKDNAYNTAPYDVTESFGHGLLDVDAAVIAAAAATPVVNPPPAPIAPGITITSPASGATVSGTVNIAVSLTGEQLTTLELKVDGVSKLAGLPVTGPSMVIPWVSSGVSDGSRVLSVILSQTGGATATASKTITVLNAVDNVAPTCTITAPANGSTIGKKGLLTITVTASDDRSTPTIRTYANGGLIKTVTSTSSSVKWKYFNVPAGNVAITATATDAAGNVSSTATVNVTKTA